MECVKTRKLCKELTSLGAEVVPYVASRYAPAGYPDRIIWDIRWCGWIEFKDYTTTVKDLQWERIRRLNMRWPGHAVLVRFDKDTHMIGDILCAKDLTIGSFLTPLHLLESLKEWSLQQGCVAENG